MTARVLFDDRLLIMTRHSMGKIVATLTISIARQEHDFYWTFDSAASRQVLGNNEKARGMYSDLIIAVFEKNIITICIDNSVLRLQSSLHKNLAYVFPRKGKKPQ